MKRFKKFFITLCSAFAFLTANAQLELPATITNEHFEDNSIFIVKDKWSINSSNEISNDAVFGDYWGSFTIQLKDAPSTYSFEVTRNKYGTNQELCILESSDNQNWTEIYKGAPTQSWESVSGKLSPDTRFIQITYNCDYKFGDLGNKYVYIRNFTINAKPFYTNDKTITSNGPINQKQQKEIKLNIKDLKGDLIVESDNQEITITPDRIARDEALANRNATFTVSYTPNAVKETTANITVKDELDSESYENINITFDVIPSVPVLAEPTDITANSFVLNWEAVEGFSYLVTIKKDGEILPDYNEVPCEGNSLLISGLEPNTIYTAYVKETNGKETSEAAVSSEITTQTPVIIVSDIEQFKTVSSQPVTQELTVSSKYLLENINIALANGEAFTIDKNTIENNEGETTLTITYNPTIYGEEKDTLTLSSNYAENVIVELIGTNALEAPTALDAENITNSSFIARWEKIEDATDYLLTVLDANNEPLTQYNGINTGNVDNFTVTNLQPTTNYTYYLQTVVNNVVSEETSNQISVTTADGAVITYTPVLKDFTTENNTSYQQTLRIIGTNVFDNITISLTGDNSFSCDNTTVPAEGGLAVVTYAPKSIGQHMATLTLSTVGADNVVINLIGHSTPGKVEAIEATNINTNSFVAQWNNMEGAENYILSVYKGDKVLQGYNEIEVGNTTSYEVNGLEEATYYNYTVKATGAGSTGNASDRISVRTLFTPSLSVVSTTSNMISVKWNEPFKADKYLVTLKKDGTPVDGYNNKEVNSQSFTFTNLNPETTYQCSVAAQFGETKIASNEINATTAQNTLVLKQLNNSDFEKWEGSGNTYEPTDWNSFGTGTGSQIGTAVSMGGTHMSESTDVRPGSNGQKSVKIWTTSIFGIKANGNITTGRINAGAMNAQDPQNYNFTDITTEEFSERLNSRPDSLTVWVKYTSASSDSKARVSAIIHDNYSYRDPSGSDAESPNHVVANAELNFSNNGGAWQRLSIPFNYKGNQLNPDFLLVSFTSNMTPGGGSADDAVFIDDMCLIYKPSLKIGAYEKKSYKAGEAISITYEIQGSMSVYNLNAQANTVSLQLSDDKGSFDAAKTLTTITTNESGLLTAQLPADLVAGGKYKLRVVTTNYPMTATSENSFTIEAEAEAASISYTGETNFEATIGGVPQKKVLTITGKNIEGNIFVSTDSKSFTVAPEVLPAEGGKVTVTYAPTTVGSETANLTISAKNVENKVVKLEGMADAPSTSIDNASDYQEISIYPNPVVDVANIIGTEDDARYCIYSIEGKMVKSGRLSFSTVNVAELPNGMYFLVVENKKVKFVK